MTKQFKFLSYLDGYKVDYVGDGIPHVHIGFVRLFERRYNLRRVLLVKGWRATTARAELHLWTRDGYTAETREGAARVLLEKHRNPVAHCLRPDTCNPDKGHEGCVCTCRECSWLRKG